MKADVRTDGRTKSYCDLNKQRFSTFRCRSAWHCIHSLPFTVVARHSERWCFKPVQWSVTAVVYVLVCTVCTTVVCCYRVAVWRPIPLAARHGPAAARFLGLRVRILPSGMYVCLLWVLCCQVKVSATGWSLIQRNPTESVCHWV
jgi:hypothetical protein